MNERRTEAGAPPAQALRRHDRVPAGVYLLGFSLFAMGSAEFLLAGVLPAVAADFDVSLASAGFLITAFAIGVVVGGPVFAVSSLRWPRRTALVCTQFVFAASVGIGLIGSFPVLMATRVLAGVAYAGFFAVASVTAVSLAPPSRAARASGVLVSGLSIAMVAGGPAGTLLSHFTQWRGGFWAVVVLTVLGAAGCRFGLRPARAVSSGPAPNVSSEMRGLRRPALWVLYGITILTTAAYMITFNYLSAMLSTITKLSEGWIPAVLALFGVGAFIGLSIGGRIADRRPRAALLVGALGITALSLVMIVAIRYIWAAVPTVLLLGVVAFVLNPAIYGRVFTVAAVAPTLAGATTVSAFQFGISITPVLAAVPLDHGGSLTSVCIIGAVLSAAAASLIIPMDSSKPDI